MKLDKVFEKIAYQFIEMPLKIDSALLLQIQLYADSQGLELWQVIQNDLCKVYPKEGMERLLESSTQYLPKEIREQMDKAQSMANEYFYKAQTQTPDEAKKTIAQGRQILENAVQICKAIK